LPGVRYLQSSKLLSVPMPTAGVADKLSDTEVIDWLWKLFAIVFGDSLGKTTEPN